MCRLLPALSASSTDHAYSTPSSELVSWSSKCIYEAVRACLESCELSPEIVQVLIGCEAEAAEALTGDERIDSLLFIGSEPVGRKVAAKAGAAGIQVSLELGGKVCKVCL